MLSPVENDCFSNLSQEFLICTTIHKARDLGVFTGETFVRLSLDKESRMTKNFANSENPYYNEYFVFELNCTVNELMRLTILYEVRKRTTCKKSITLGELLIDIQSVWTQPNRCFFKKWGRLETPIRNKDHEATAGSNKDKDKKKDKSDVEKAKGYLQIDLAIVTKVTNTKTLLRPYEEGEILGINKWQINQDYDDIEKNLLQNVEHSVQCNIMYRIIFYRGYFNKKCDYMIHFRFHPFKGKTHIAKNTTQPEWNQEVSFAWTYPSLAQTYLVQLLSREHLNWKCIAEYELHFDEIAFNDKPSLGPTFIHLYDVVNPTRYVGRLVLEVRSETLIADPKRVLVMSTVPTIDEQRWWQNEHFLIEFLALQGDFIHGHFSNCKLSMKLAENVSNNIECFLKSYPTQHHLSTNLKYFKHEVPYKAIVLKTLLPDNRHKFDSDFFMQEILDYMKTEIDTFKIFQLKYTNQIQMQTKCFKAIVMSIHNKIREGLDANRLEYTGFKDPTPWDTNRLIYLQDFFNKLPDELCQMRKRLKSASANDMESTVETVLQELVQRSSELANILALTRVQDEWPELLIVLSISGNKEIGMCRLNAKYFLNPIKDKEVTPSTLCWRSRNFVFKDMSCPHTCVNCGCTVAIIQGLLGVVVEHERNDYLTTISPDWKQSETFYWNPTVPYTVFKCRLFIHQAKVRPGNDRSGLCDAHVRIVFGSQSAETNTELATLSPIWNAVISFECICMAGSILWYRQNPPLVAVELYDSDRLTSDDYLGCGMLSVSIICRDGMDTNIRDDLESERKPGQQGDFGTVVKTKNALQKFQSLKNLSPPPLKWVPISMKGGVRAEVLMSAELVEMPCRSEKITASPPTITYGIPNGIRPNMRNYVLEVVFAGFRNYNMSGSSGPAYMAGRHRIKIMMGDLLLQSGLSTSRIKNSINFLVLYASGVVCLPEQLEYWPAIIATDVAVSARGQETTVGAVLIQNSKRYLQKDKTIKCTPIVETDMESNVVSTTVHMEDFDNAETSPLITKDNNINIFNRVFCAMIPKRVNIQAIPTQTSKISTHDLKSGGGPLDMEYNWWTKFYNSLYKDSSKNFKHTLTVYSHELEKQAEFSYMHDWAEPVKLVHGIKYKKKSIPMEEVYATLKLHLKLTPCQCGASGDCNDGDMLRPLAAALNPRYQAKLQSLAELCKIVARVYIVQGIQFRPHDKHHQSDSYVQLQLGMKIISNRAHYVPNQSNPIFGKCFQLEGVLPREHVLEVSVFDRNVGLGRDDLVGSTYIDLEDRWRTQHRATMGIANEYCKNGYNKWRDISTPYEILTDLCMKSDIKPPVFIGNNIELDGLEFSDETKIARDEDMQERLSLTVLKNFEKLPSFGYKLVPEHVETRSLYRNDCPGIEQGKIQLWIELYEGNLNIPAAIDITPQPPQIFELRVTIINCGDVVLDEKNIFGKHMSDIFVKGWCHDVEQVQETDIHYRSLNGEASFNWRMIFPVKYSSVEDMMVIKRKGGRLEEYETKQPPLLHLQIWDNDLVSQDDFLGSLEINLSNFPQPFDSQKSCTLANSSGWRLALPFSGDGGETRKPMNLFRQKRIQGWFPVRGPLQDKSDSSKHDVGMTGKIELELEILSDAEAVANPAGFGRNPPNALPAPVRPDTSFNPFLNPVKSFTKILLPVIRKFALYIFLGLVVVIIVYTTIINLPSDFLGWVSGWF